jgi:hypothetical protein
MGWWSEPSVTSRKEMIEKVSKGSIRHCYRGGPGSGVVWSVREFYPVDNQGIHIHDKDQVTRYIACDLIQYREQEWWHKPMDETVGPYYYSCPLSYLNIVSKPLNEWSKEWREKVKMYHATKKMKKHEYNREE